MKTFVKFNLFSFLFGFFLFIGEVLLIDQIRIVRLISWLSYRKINSISLILFVAGTVFLIFIAPKYLSLGKWKYLFIVSWFPYYLFLDRMHRLIFPLTNSNDIVSNGTGLVGFAMFCLYPLYILIIILIGVAIDFIKNFTPDTN